MPWLLRRGAILHTQEEGDRDTQTGSLSFLGIKCLAVATKYLETVCILLCVFTCVEMHMQVSFHVVVKAQLGPADRDTVSQKRTRFREKKKRYSSRQNLIRVLSSERS